MKIKAFTLAETLITLTIIGVVAAMTIPTLASKYQKHTYVVGLKKAYAELVQAFKMIPLTENCSADDYSCLGDVSSYSKQLDLFAKQYKNSTIIDYPISPLNKALRTADGKYIMISESDIDASDLIVDINGDKGPNKFGRDRFMFSLDFSDNQNTRAGIYPYGSKNFETWGRDVTGVGDLYLYWNTNPASPYCRAGISEEDMKHYCTGRVLEEDAMNY